jgi:predicted  nucleic acid-binding Zn-ribbon protein
MQPLTEEQEKLRTLEHELTSLRSRHETLGGAYRGACAELERLRKEVASYKARLDAVRVLCEVSP